MTYLQATATRPRRAVFSILLVWALVDAVLTFCAEPTGWIAIALSIFSLLASLWFVGLIAMDWDWITRRRNA